MAKRAPPLVPPQPGAAGRFVVPISPALGMLEALALGASLATRLAGRSRASVVCDLAAVPVATVATFQAVALVALATRRHDGTLFLRNASPQVRDALTLFGLWDELRMPPPPEGGDVAGPDSRSLSTRRDSVSHERSPSG